MCVWLRIAYKRTPRITPRFWAVTHRNWRHRSHRPSIQPTVVALRTASVCSENGWVAAAMCRGGRVVVNWTSTQPRLLPWASNDEYNYPVVLMTSPQIPNSFSQTRVQIGSIGLNKMACNAKQRIHTYIWFLFDASCEQISCIRIHVSSLCSQPKRILHTNGVNPRENSDTSEKHPKIHLEGLFIVIQVITSIKLYCTWEYESGRERIVCKWILHASCITYDFHKIAISDGKLASWW